MSPGGHAAHPLGQPGEAPHDPLPDPQPRRERGQRDGGHADYGQQDSSLVEAADGRLQRRGGLCPGTGQKDGQGLVQGRGGGGEVPGELVRPRPQRDLLAAGDVGSIPQRRILTRGRQTRELVPKQIQGRLVVRAQHTSQHRHHLYRRGIGGEPLHAGQHLDDFRVGAGHPIPVDDKLVYYISEVVGRITDRGRIGSQYGYAERPDEGNVDSFQGLGRGIGLRVLEAGFGLGQDPQAQCPQPLALPGDRPRRLQCGHGL